jgi:hypothetical protein
VFAKDVVTDFETRIKIQRDRIRRGEYQHLGLLSVISLDKEKGQRLPTDQARVIGRVIDLMGDRVPLGISLDGIDLLLYAGFPKKLPDIVDPNYPGRMTLAEKTPFIKQTWADRASGETYIAGTDMIVAQPVMKLILVGDPASPLAKLGWPMIPCRADDRGRHMTFLLDPRKGEGFLVGGKFQFSTRVARAEARPVLASA